MRFAVIGAGAVGGYFGGRLAEAGYEVTFIARGRTLDALRSQGLVVKSLDGDFCRAVQATDDPASVGPVDCVIFGVKAWQVEAAARSALPLFGAESFALPLLNGIEVPIRLAEVLGAERVLGGLCRIIAKVETPGSIHHFGARPTIELGELDGSSSERTEAFRQAAERAGIAVKIPEAGIQTAMWGKFMFIVATSAVGAVTRSTIGEIRGHAETRRLLETAIREIWHLGRQRGIALSHDAVERSMAFIDQLPAETTASMQRDWMADRPSELDAQSGAVLRLARESGVDVPVNAFLHAALILRETRSRQATTSS